MRSVALLCLFSALALSGCGGDDPSDPDTLGLGGSGQRGPAAPQRITEMSRVAYNSAYYRAVVSGSSNPTRVLMEVTGDYWGLRGQYVFLCDAGEHFCEQKTPEGKAYADVAFSGDLTQIILRKYSATGTVDYTASFVRN